MSLEDAAGNRRPYISLEESTVIQSDFSGAHRALSKRQRVLGAAVALAMSCGGPAVFAADNFWNGMTSNDWNTPSNWSLATIPAIPDHARIDTNVPNTATITADVPQVVDIIVGMGAGANGVVNHSAGSAATGNDNWMFVGRDGGTGVYNLGDASTTGGTFSGIGLGSGSLTTSGGGRLYVAGHDGAAATGTLNINTTGTVTIGSDLNLGAANGTGTVNLDAGTVTVGSWLSIGRDENGNSGTGNYNQSGGSMTVSGHTILGLPGTKGNLNMTGGTLTINGELWAGQAGSGGVPSVGVASVNGGTVTVNNWIAIGRDGSVGTLSVGGTGVVQHQTSGHITIGTGAGGTGTVNVSGNGTLSTTANLIVAENNATAVGVVNQTGGTVRVGGNLEVQRVGTGTYALSGGTLEVNGVIDGVDGTFAFTGGKISRSNPGVITYEGNLTTGGMAAVLDLDTDKTFDVNGIFNVAAGNGFELTGMVIPLPDGVDDTGSFLLGTVDSIVGTFGPGITAVNGLTTNGATFITEAQGEGGLYPPGSPVFWIQEASGNVTLNYNVVIPEPGTAALLGVASLAVLRRRRKA